MLAYYHLLSKADGAKIRDLEDIRKITYFTQIGDAEPKEKGKPYNRTVDIILGDDKDTEIWVELKSIKSPLKSGSFRPSKIVGKNSTSRHIHREFTADWIGGNARPDLSSNPDILQRNIDIEWRFQSFITKATPREQGPKESEMTLPRTKLCVPPDAPRGFFKGMYNQTKSTFESDCKGDIRGIVQIQNTKSMLRDVFIPKGVLLDMADLIPD